MDLRTASERDVQGFVECYLDVWRSLKRILPDEYVDDQIERASTAAFKDHMSSEISDTDSIILVAEEGTETVGIAWGNLKEDGSAWLAFMGVSQEHRRRGVGRSLLTRFIEESRGRGSRKVSLDTDPRLVPAVELYLGMGFTSEGVVKNPYGLELVVYSKDIS
jgi:ribosomal protein S18 acetylase RimI-like enzyme